MFDRKLNGILADEMGLGKTIQTIALLAHLACEKGNFLNYCILFMQSQDFRCRFLFLEIEECRK